MKWLWWVAGWPLRGLAVSSVQKFGLFPKAPATGFSKLKVANGMYSKKYLRFKIVGLRKFKV